MVGTIIRGIGGFYYVKTETEIVECKARGVFRHKEITPVVGDVVDITVSNGKGVIDKIHERTSSLIRPLVSNVTQAFIIFSIKNPDINIELLNKFLVMCEYNNLKVIVCFNKLDIGTESDSEAVAMVQAAGYETLFLRALEGIGLEQIEQRLKDNISVFCGPSGVGKSTTLNKIAGFELMKTGEISEKANRGKHTTRHSELVEIKNGFVVDTPGFSSLDIDYIKKDELKDCFPEFEKAPGNCKFNSCMHHKEPNCKVKFAVEQGTINKLRYDYYIKALNELKDRRN